MIPVLLQDFVPEAIKGCNHCGLGSGADFHLVEDSLHSVLYGLVVKIELSRKLRIRGGSINHVFHGFDFFVRKLEIPREKCSSDMLMVKMGRQKEGTHGTMNGSKGFARCFHATNPSCPFALDGATEP